MHATVEGPQRGGGGGDVGRLRVVHVGDPADLGDSLEPVGDAPEAAQAAHDGIAIDPRRKGDRGDGHGVAQVVLAGERKLGGGEQRAVGVKDLAAGKADRAIGPGRARLDPVRRRRRPAGQIETREGGIVGVDHGDVARPLIGEDPQLRAEVVSERAVAVEVIGTEVEQHGDLRGEGLGVLELEGRALADDRRAGIERTGHRGERRTHVAGQRMGLPGRLADGTEPFSHGRLAVRAGYGEEAVGQQAPAELELADHRQPPLVSRDDRRRRRRHAGTLDHRANPVHELKTIVIQTQFDAELRKPCGSWRISRIRAVDARAEPQQRLSGGHPGAGEPDDQVGPGRQGRSFAVGGHLSTFANP